MKKFNAPGYQPACHNYCFIKFLVLSFYFTFLSFVYYFKVYLYSVICIYISILLHKMFNHFEGRATCSVQRATCSLTGIDQWGLRHWSLSGRANGCSRQNFEVGGKVSEVQPRSIADYLL